MGRGKNLTTDIIIAKSKMVHGYKYDYSLVIYKNLKTNINIICNEHGVFEQSPSNHIFNAAGCPKCYGNKKSSTEIFITNAKKFHGDKYDYRLVEYRNNYTKIKIICPDHGIFEQKPNNHLTGQGCLICSGKHTKTTSEFIELAKNVHGDKYDYSLVKYVNNNTKVKIVCKIHGIYEQEPNSHISGKRECPSCKKSKGENLL